MQATALSKVATSSNPTIKPTKTRPLNLVPWPPNNTNYKWPATIFAANRTVSIITVTGIKTTGIPTET